MAEYDVVVIGGGAGGRHRRLRAGQLGLERARVDKGIDGRGTLGGTCLNVGCMPSKALLHASELFEIARKDFAGLGIDGEVKINLPAMMRQKADSVAGLTKG